MSTVFRTFLFLIVILTPIMGMVLNGFEVNFYLLRPLTASLAITFIIFLYQQAKSLPDIFSKLSHYLQHKISIPDSNLIFSGFTKKLNHFLSFKIVAISGLILPLVLWIIDMPFLLPVAISALIYVLLGLGLNIVVGLAGLLDLGFVAFYAVGAYTYALGMSYFGINFFLCIPIACIMAALFGALLALPVLRLHKDYLAIVTLGFGEIIYQLLNNLESYTGGPNGIEAPFPSIMGIEFTKTAKMGGTLFYELIGIGYNPIIKNGFLYVLLICMVLIVYYFVEKLIRSPLGRALEAIREDEIGARSLGLNPLKVKLMAFSLGASIAGIGGVFFAAHQGFISPSSFTFGESALILAIVVLGGLGSPKGVVISGIVVTMLPELLREFDEYRLLIFGFTLIAMMIWRPYGLIKAKRFHFTLKKGTQNA